jgi:hypothetical protein
LWIKRKARFGGGAFGTAAEGSGFEVDFKSIAQRCIQGWVEFAV